MSKAPFFSIGQRSVGADFPPLVIAEIGINHEGSFDKAITMIDDACKAGCECVKFQCHVVEDEMAPAAQKVIPGNAKDSIWDIMKRCELTEKQEHALKKYVEDKKMLFLSTPFSRAAFFRLQTMGLFAYKIGSGECNNYPLIELIAADKKPVILSTGMNDIDAIARAVSILRRHKVPFALMHCTSIYPTPYEKVRLGALSQLKEAFPDTVLGLSDHSLSNFPCLGAVALGASLLERHFTSSKQWEGPDIAISMDPQELVELIVGSRALFLARGGTKGILPEEKPTIDFAYATVCAIRDIAPQETLNEKNVWVKRPGTGQIKACDFEKVLGKVATRSIAKGKQLQWSDLERS